MAEDKKQKVEKTEEQKKQQKNRMVLFAIAVLIGAGIYYFYNSSKINSNTSVNDIVTQAPKDADSNQVAQLTSKKWTWLNTKMNDGAVTSPSKEGAFTTTFQPDKRLIATTDCNNGNGSYELGENNSLTIGPMATTMMFCEGSNEGVYFQQLSNVGSYKIENGQLWLMLKFDSGTMIFE